jgi:hypothetical protein
MTTQENKPSWLFWTIAFSSIIWNSMGVHAYLQQAYKTEHFQSMYSEEQQTMIHQLPSYYTAVFAIAVFFSVMASLLLLARNKLAISIFFIALIAVILQTGFNVFIYEGRELYGSMEYLMLAFIPLVSLFLYRYSKKALTKMWIS